jgi:dTDP-4-amino-4,6-dideoxygalactose transaminase
VTEAASTQVDEFLAFAKPDITQAEIDEVVDTLRSGWLTGGPKVAAFEEAFCRLTGAKHAVALSSCTAGMHLALLASGIGPGDEVITVPLTFASTVSVILHAGATPVLADVRDYDYNIDPADVEHRITARTKAIMPVHYGGHPCAMDELLAIARKHKLRVIEDAAHAVGSSYRGRPIGAIGDAAVFSFYVIKNITTGQGGMLTTDDEQLAEHVRLLRLHGLSKTAWDRYSEKGTWAYQVLAPGFNYAMTDIQAALGIQQLNRLEEMQARRHELVSQYDEHFSKLREIITPPRHDEVVHGWHLYPIRLHLDQLTINRADFIEELRAAGIGTSVHFIPVHLHPYFRETMGWQPGDFPVAEGIFENLITMPLYSRMTDHDVERAATAVRKIIETNRA